MDKIKLNRLTENLYILSNRSKEKGNFNNQIYSSFHFTGFTNIKAVRNTLKRLNIFSVPPRLDGVKILDLGCNIGALSMECANRGADVTGLEYNEDHVI